MWWHSEVIHHPIPHGGLQALCIILNKSSVFLPEKEQQEPLAHGHRGKSAVRKGEQRRSPATSLLPWQLSRSKQLLSPSIVNLLLPLAGQRGYSWKAAAPRAQPALSYTFPALTGIFSPENTRDEAKSLPSSHLGMLDEPCLTSPLGREGMASGLSSFPWHLLPAAFLGVTVLADPQLSIHIHPVLGSPSSSQL